jgi:RNA polymerase sigma factor (sigma-70 family)
MRTQTNLARKRSQKRPVTAKSAAKPRKRPAARKVAAKKKASEAVEAVAPTVPFPVPVAEDAPKPKAPTADENFDLKRRHPARDEANVDIYTLYAREMGSVDLLTPEQEVTLAREMDGARKGLKKLYRKHTDLAIAPPPRETGDRSEEEFQEKVERLFEGVTRTARQVERLKGQIGTARGKGRAPRTLSPGQTAARKALRELRKNTGLTPTQIFELRQEVTRLRRELKGTRDQMIMANLRLVPFIARKYLEHGLTMTDLVQEGNIGLMKAVDRFDPNLGYKFSTYAYWWVKQSIERAIADRARTIRVPVHVHEKIRKIRAVSARLNHQLGRRPTPEEISSEANIPASKVTEFLRAAMDPVPLDHPIQEGDEREWKQVLPDEEAPSPLFNAMNIEQADSVRDALSMLGDKEERVVRMRFGIDLERTYTLEEVGRQLR